MATENLITAEEWRAIPGHEHYEVSSLGRVRRATASRTSSSGYMMKLHITRYGYLQVALSLEGKYTYFFAHRLVAMAFLPPQPSLKHQIAHWDGNRQNNCVENLRWATAKENHDDKRRHGKEIIPLGSAHGQSKTTEADVSEIRRRRKLGEKPSDLAKEFGLSRPTISGILHFKVWKHVK